MEQDNDSERNRRSVRMKGWDYGKRGIYFVTICTAKMKTYFGRVRGGRTELNAAGVIVREEWLRTARIRAGLELDVFVIMPNHFHGVFLIMQETRRGVLQYAPTAPGQFRSPSRDLGAIVRGFKAAVTLRVRKIWQHPGAQVWQRNYYEHVVKDGRDLRRIRQYVSENPAMWEFDRYNPKRIQERMNRQQKGG